MSRTSSLSQLTTLPVLADAADITAVGTTMADQIEKKLWMRFASIVVRDATITSPEEGMVAVITADDRWWIYSGSAWVFGGNYTSTSRSGVILTDVAQTIGTGVPADITWTTEVSDVDGWTSGGSATLTVPTGWDGRYIITYQGTWTSSVTASSCSLFVNGASVAIGSPDAATWNRNTLTILQTLAAADTVKIQVLHASGVNKDVSSRLEVAWLGR